MCRNLSFLISVVLVLSLASTTYGIVIGNFENQMDGWVVYDDPCSLTDPNVSVSYSDTNGVTLDSYSLKIVADEGRQQAVIYSLVDNNQVSEFMSSDHIKIDITRLAEEWMAATCYPWSQVSLIIEAGNDPCDPNAWELSEQLNQSAGWSPPYWVGDYNSIPGYDVNRPTTYTYFYPHLLPDINLVNLEYLNIILVTNYDPNYITGGVYYIDNVQMLTSPRASALLIGDFEHEGTFEDEDDPGWYGQENVTLTYDTIGATSGSKSLKIVSPGHHQYEDGCTLAQGWQGWDNAIDFEIGGHPSPDMVDNFMNGWKVTMDVTRRVEDWPGDPCDGFTEFRFAVNYSAGRGVRWDNNPEVAYWHPSEGDQTTTITYYYPDSLPNINPDAIYYLQLFFCTNFDPCYPGPGVFYIDNIQLHFQAVTEAHTPDPCDGAINMRCDPTLNWKPGQFANKHDVYFGTDYNDVNEATISEPCGVFIRQDYDSNSIDIANDVNLLEFDTTYYWRVDEVNVLGPDPCYWKGNVWSFTTGHHLIVEDFEEYINTAQLDVVWSAKSSISATSDMLRNQHGGRQAMALMYDNTLTHPYSEAYADTADINNVVGNNWRLQDVKALELWFHGIPDYRGSHSGTGTVADPYVLNGDGSGLYKTKYDTCYFFYKSAATLFPMVQARVVSIEDTDPCAMTGVIMRDTLDAGSAYYATVVTSDGRAILMARTTANGTGNPAGFVSPSTVSGITLPHWVRITRLSSGTPPGKIRAEHANDVNGTPGTWQKISGADSSGSMPIGSGDTYIGLCVTSNVSGDICTAEIDNVTMTPAGPPTTGVDIGDYVYNDPEPVYVTLQDINDVNWTEYYENKDTNATRTSEWTQWRLDLKDFNDHFVDPCYVERIYIGVGDKTTPPPSPRSGAVFIDDIILYAAEFYEPKCPPLQADLVRDGEVNYRDLKLIADNWLIHDYDVTPVAPPNEPNLIAWYRLEQDACDSAGPIYQNGEPNGIKPADYVTGMEGNYALDLKGDANFIETDYNATSYGIGGNNARTITAWAKTRSFDEFAAVYEIGGYAEGGQDFSMLTNGAEPNVWRANHEGGPETWDIDFEYPSLNEWVHFAHAYDGATVRVYADGYAVASRVLDLNTTDTKTFGIGRWSSWDSNLYFDGTVDDVRIYNYALNPNEAAYIARYPDANGFAQPLGMLLTPSDHNINLYDNDAIVTSEDPFLNVEVINSNDPCGITWAIDPCAYPVPNGRWYRYPNYGWWNIWLYNAPYTPYRWKEIIIEVNVVPILDGLQSDIEIIVGGSTGAWSALGNNRPPLPGDVPTPALEDLYIDRTIPSNDVFTFSGILPPGLTTISRVISIPCYNPEWVFVDVRGENFVLLYGDCYIRHECRLDIINFRDFAEFAKHWRQRQVWPTWDP